MSDPDKKKLKEQLIIKGFEQHWLHGRHVETERFWMLQIYIIITVAFYTVKIADSFLKEIFTPATDKLVWLIVFLFIIHIIYSIFNLLASIKLSAEYDRHNSLAINILEKNELGDLMQRPLQHNKKGYVKFMFSNFLSFNRLIANIYILFISVDAFVIIASLTKCTLGFIVLLVLVLYVILFYCSLCLKNKLGKA